MPQVTIINKFGTLQGWNSITVHMLGRDLEGITALKYGDEKKKENAYGGGEYPVGRTEGNYEPEASLSLYKEEVDSLQNALPAGSRIQDIFPFDIEVVYEKKDGSLQRDRILNCEFTKRGVDVKQADGSITNEMPLICSHILYNI